MLYDQSLRRLIQVGEGARDGYSTRPRDGPYACDAGRVRRDGSSSTAQKGFMKTPPALQSLIDDGVIDEVVRSLKSGKEATVYLVRTAGQARCAKVYRDMRQRSFQKRAQYQEGRKVRGSRQARAMRKSHVASVAGSRKPTGRTRKSKRSTGLAAAGVRVPKPYGYFNDTLVMELVVDAAGDPAPRLSEVDLTPDVARTYHAFLIRQIVRMLSIGLIHGDLSEFNVLIGPDGPVIIDLPQVVNAAGNNGALAMLERDVNNIRGSLGRFAPELLSSQYAREMWALFEQGELAADSELTGLFARDETAADAGAVLAAVDDAREEAIRRQLGRDS